MRFLFFFTVACFLFPLFAHEDPPRVFLLNSQDLILLRHAILKQDPLFEPAVKALLDGANEALEAPLHSVIDKRLTPPSHTKNDYFSLARYWWPDPSKANGIPYLHRDCEINPEIWSEDYDYARLQKMQENCLKLCLAYYFTSNEAYAMQAAKIIKRWFLNPETRMNPHLNYSQSIPGIRSGGHNGIIETYQFPLLFDGIRLIANSSAWTKEDEDLLLVWCAEYLNWLLTSPLGVKESKSENNHGSWYDVQVIYFALHTSQSHLARRFFVKQTQKKLREQFLEDGTQPFEMIRDKSFHYCIYNLQALYNCALLATHLHKDLWELKKSPHGTLRKALDLLIPYIEGHKTWVKKDNEDLDPTKAASLLLIACTVYHDQKYLDLYSQIMKDFDSQELLRLLYPSPFLALIDHTTLPPSAALTHPN